MSAGDWILPAVELDSVPRREAAFRFEYFLLKVGRHGRFWVLQGDGFATLTADDGRALLPCWPHSDFARAAAVGAWTGFQPLAISLERFLDTGVKQMAASGLRLMVFPVEGASGLLLDAPALARAFASGAAAGTPERQEPRE